MGNSPSAIKCWAVDNTVSGLTRTVADRAPKEQSNCQIKIKAIGPAARRTTRGSFQRFEAELSTLTRSSDDRSTAPSSKASGAGCWAVAII